ncbi:MAG TPA: hypothetical protein PLV92_09755 [Pirellulaceae bacterium]|nr:hypothetical protein [Pirellulaceae bacterium]
MNIATILAVLLSIFFIVTLVFSVKTWKWFHIFFGLCVYGAALTFICYAAMSLKTRTVWSSKAQALEVQVEQATAKAEALRNGDPAQSPPDQLSFLRGAQHEFARLLINRGRVWRQCTMASINPMTRSVKLGTTPPAPAEPSPNRLEVKAVVYLFREAQVPQVIAPNVAPVAMWVPVAYIGEFQVSEATENDVTLQETLRLDAQQEGLLAAAPDARYTIYEKCPTDTADAYAGLNEQQIRSLLPNALQVDPQRYEALIQTYLRDGQDPLPTDPEARLWIEVEFTLDTEEVVVDSASTQVDRDSKYYDDQGGALIPTLRRGSKVKFAKQQKAILPQAKANELISRGVCKKVRDVYRREVRDYVNDFHEIATQTTYLQDRIAEVARQTAILVEAQKKAQLQIDYRTQEKQKLEADLVKVSAERDAVTKYAERLAAAVKDAQSRAGVLFKQNLALADELAAMQKKMTDEIDRRTQEAAAATPVSTRR